MPELYEPWARHEVPVGWWSLRGLVTTHMNAATKHVVSRTLEDAPVPRTPDIKLSVWCL